MLLSSFLDRLLHASLSPIFVQPSSLIHCTTTNENDSMNTNNTHQNLTGALRRGVSGMLGLLSRPHERSPPARASASGDRSGSTRAISSPSTSTARSQPVVFVHAVFFTPKMMGRLSLKLRYIPVTAIVITVGVPMPSTPVKPGSSYHITFTILERTTVTDGPCGAVSAYIQRRDMTETEKEELEEKSTSEAPLSQAGGM